MHTDTLVNEYVHVVNQAIGRHKDEFPYKQLLDISDTVFGGRDLRMDVYSDDSDKVHDHFMLRFEDGKLDLVDHGKDDAEITWKVARAHVEEVVDAPETYIEHPERLDLDWLRHRV